MINKSNFIKSVSDNKLTSGRNKTLSQDVVQALMPYIDSELLESCAVELSMEGYLDEGYDLLSIGYLKFFDTNKQVVLDFMARAAEVRGYRGDDAMLEYVTTGSDCVYTENAVKALTLGVTISQIGCDDCGDDPYRDTNNYDAVAEFCVSECIIQTCYGLAEFLGLESA